MSSELESFPEVVDEALLGILQFSPVVGPLAAPVVLPILQVGPPMRVHTVRRLIAIACRGGVG